MDANNTDIFISYRRIDGRDIARSLYLALTGRGYKNVFFDYNSMREGMFNEQILTAIANCKDFIIVLSPLSMVNCAKEGDWVAREIDAAIEAGCKIIPVQINDAFTQWPQDFPKRFNFIKQIEFLTLRTDEYFDASISRLQGWLSSKASIDTKTTDSEDFCLSIYVDETCNLLINRQKIRKIKAGKEAGITNIFEVGKKYTLTFESLQSKTNPIDIEYTRPDIIKSDKLNISFAQARKEAISKKNREREIKEEALRIARQKEGVLLQACEQYDWSGCQADGMTAVCTKGKIGYLNEDAFESISCIYENASAFYNGYATVCQNNKWGIIDKLGQTIIPLESETPCYQTGGFKYFVFCQNNKFGISTIDQGIPKELPYDSICGIVGHPDVFFVYESGIWKMLNYNGCKSTIEDIEIHSILGRSKPSTKLWRSPEWTLQLLETPLGIKNNTSKKIGYLNSELKLTIPFADEGSGRYISDPKYVIIKSNKKMGIANIESGKFIVPPIYEDILPLGNPYETKVFRIADKSLLGDHIIIKDKEIIMLNKGWPDSKPALIGGNQGILTLEGKFIIPQVYDVIIYCERMQSYIAIHLENLKTWHKKLKSINCTDTHYYRLELYYENKGSFFDIYSENGHLLSKVSFEEIEPMDETYWFMSPFSFSDCDSFNIIHNLYYGVDKRIDNASCHSEDDYIHKRTTIGRANEYERGNERGYISLKYTITEDTAEIHISDNI